MITFLSSGNFRVSSQGTGHLLEFIVITRASMPSGLHLGVGLFWRDEHINRGVLFRFLVTWHFFVLDLSYETCLSYFMFMGRRNIVRDFITLDREYRA